MSSLQQHVSLHDIRFFAFHGFYPEEQKTGNEFSVDIELAFDLTGTEDSEDLNHTANYEKLFAIAKEVMQEPQKLLETVARKILDQVKEAFDFATEIKVAIRKMHLPIAGEIGHAKIELVYHR